MTCANYYKPRAYKDSFDKIDQKTSTPWGSEEMKKRIKECNSKQHNELQMKNSLTHSFYIAFMSVLFLKCFLSFLGGSCAVHDEM